jgi:hypothetical protein
VTEDQAWPLAIGWATVELERAAAELSSGLAPGGGFRTAPSSELLGARCLVGRAATGSPATWLVLLEPSTEGRIAASLVRHGEGWAASWDLPAPADVEQPAAPAWSVEADGPLGRERLQLGGPASGPHRLRVTAATIEP